jgi:hypothetical protein
MIDRTKGIIGLLLGLLLISLRVYTAQAQPAAAQAGQLPVISNDIVVDFPNTAAFRLEL